MEKKFTDKFIKLPLFVVKNYEEEMMGKDAPKKKIIGRIDPRQISQYFPDYVDKGEEPKTAVLFIDGSTACVVMNITDFEDALNKFVDTSEIKVNDWPDIPSSDHSTFNKGTGGNNE